MKEMNRPVLFDLGFHILPFIRYPKVCDYINILMGILTLGTMTFLHPYPIKVWKRLVVIQGSIFLFRSFTIVVTLLPNCDKECVPSKVAGSEEENVIKETFLILLGQRVTCGDLLFSGHASNLTLMASVFQEYIPGVLRKYTKGPRVYTKYTLIAAFWCIAALGYFLIIATQ